MMKQLIAFSALLLLPVFIMAQSFGLPATQAFRGLENPAQKTEKPQLRLNMHMGSMFFSSSAFGSGFGTYVAPVVTYPATKKFQLQFGTTLYRGYNQPMLGFNPAEGSLNFSQRDMSTATVHVSGLYQVNPRLTIHGSAYKQFDLMAVPTANPQAFNFEQEGFSAGFNFRLTDNIHISGAVDYNRGNNLYHNRGILNNRNGFMQPAFYW